MVSETFYGGQTKLIGGESISIWDNGIGLFKYVWPLLANEGLMKNLGKEDHKGQILFLVTEMPEEDKI